MVLLACVLGVAFVACAPPTRTIQLRFTSGQSDGIQRLQFYVHDVVLLGSQGNEHRATFISQPPWQNERVALIDLSPGEGSQRHDFVEVHASGHPYRGVRFSIGVPFEANHSNPLNAPPPLNRGELFWSWQTGYKFLRLDLAGAAPHEAAFHLGSTGCSSASALRPPRQACAQPNVITIELSGFDPATHPIQVRVDEIVEALREERIACTGDYTPASCARALAATGLDLKTGRCAGSGSSVCVTQTLFLGPQSDAQ